MVKFGTQITAKNLCKSFGSTSVLKGIDLAVSSGEFVAVVGRSGCGKSTLLRVIAGLDHPTEGSVYADVFKVDGIQSDIRIMFQDSRLLPWKRVVDNVQLGLKGERQNDARDALRLVGLEDRNNDWQGVLSGGQKQRVALARALASHPRLLLLDEPLGALDALTRIEMQELIESIWRQQKFTAFLVTHDVSEAIALADRVILIEDGKISLDLDIPLSRPRERNGDFIYFEKLILDRLMQRTESVSAQEQTG